MFERWRRHSRTNGAAREQRTGTNQHPDIERELEAARIQMAAANYAEATALCHRALRGSPGSAEALCLVADIAFKTGKTAAAIATLSNGVRVNPRSADVQFKLGCLYEDVNALEPAAVAYRAALDIDPHMVKAHNNLGSVLQLMGRMSEARSEFERAYALDPTFWLARYNIGMWLKMQGRFTESVVPFQDALRGRRSPDDRHRELPTDETTTTHSKLRHDIEQLRYLVDRGLLGDDGRRAIDVLEQTLMAIGPDPERTVAVEIPSALRPRIANCYNRLLNFYDAPAITSGAVNPELDSARIEADYFANGPGMTYIDDFLTPEALASLRRFTLESTIWFDWGYSGGYVGCTFEHGFACPLLAQIAEELRAALPGIFKGARINGLWGYKYDQQRTGIGAHADFAAVNVNFWLAPDEANLDPSSGGLVVWDKEAPLDWAFDDYNNDRGRIEGFIRESGARPYVVPHRQNRVVLFNSDLFHRTDDYRFKAGYENRRVNVTILYGDRANGG